MMYILERGDAQGLTLVKLLIVQAYTLWCSAINNNPLKIWNFEIQSRTDWEHLYLLQFSLFGTLSKHFKSNIAQISFVLILHDSGGCNCWVASQEPQLRVIYGVVWRQPVFMDVQQVFYLYVIPIARNWSAFIENTFIVGTATTKYLLPCPQ